MSEKESSSVINYAFTFHCTAAGFKMVEVKGKQIATVCKKVTLGVGKHERTIVQSVLFCILQNWYKIFKTCCIGQRVKV